MANEFRYFVDGDPNTTDGGVGVTLGFAPRVEMLLTPEIDNAGNEVLDDAGEVVMRPGAVVDFGFEPGSKMDKGFLRKSFVGEDRAELQREVLAELEGLVQDPASGSRFTPEGLAAHQKQLEDERVQMAETSQAIRRRKVVEKETMTFIAEKLTDEELTEIERRVQAKEVQQEQRKLAATKEG